MPEHARPKERAAWSPLAWPRRRQLAIGAPLAVIVLLYGAWFVAGRGDATARGVQVGGVAVGGRSPEGTRQALEPLADDDRQRTVHIRTGEATLEATAAQLGLAVDLEATVAAAGDVVHDANPVVEPWLWLTTFVRTRHVTPRYAVDLEVLRAALPELEGELRTAPVEPALAAADDGGISVVPGAPGQGLDPEQVRAALLAAAPADRGPIDIAVEPTQIAPTYTDAQAQAVADQANALAASGLTMTVGSDSKQLPLATMASWMRIETPPTGIALGFDHEAVVASIKELFPSSGRDPVDARFTVEGGKPVLHPSRNGTGCCAPDTADLVLDALQAGTGAVTIPLEETEPAFTTEAAQALGIVEEVGRPNEFGPTTRFACCESRVKNIHRIADLVRGAIIKPGETFSVNGYVGRRTREKGFVEGGVIYNGRMQTDVGGGVSQFATTMFNAAFFAGLDIPEYMAHTLYISRYPRGREATISFPAPDLKITNNSPYGVLIWPTYTDTSVTVHLYSTQHVEVTAGSTSDSPSGACTRVTTPRTRTFADGTVKHDSFSARYQPEEGVLC